MIVLQLKINEPLNLQKGRNYMIYGYARVSTNKQVMSRQIDNIKGSYSIDKLFAETWTGTSEERPQWQKLLKVVKQGDTIVFDSVSRMSRNAQEGVNTYIELFSKGIELVFLNEPYINTTNYQNALQGGIATVGNQIADIYIRATNEVLKLLARQQVEQAFQQAEKEVSDLKQRTRDGMRIKDAGEKISKARKGNTYETQKSKTIKAFIVKYSKSFHGSLNDKEVLMLLKAELGKCSEPTYYRYKKELKGVNI